MSIQKEFAHSTMYTVLTVDSFGLSWLLPEMMAFWPFLPERICNQIHESTSPTWMKPEEISNGKLARYPTILIVPVQQVNPTLIVGVSWCILTDLDDFTMSTWSPLQVDTLCSSITVSRCPRRFRIILESWAHALLLAIWEEISSNSSQNL